MTTPSVTRQVSVVILLCAFALHTVGILQNLPHFPEADEPLLVSPALRMAVDGSLNPQWFGNPGSTMIYPLAAIYSLWMNLDGTGSAIRIAEQYLLGRYLAAFYAVATVALALSLGRKLFGAPVGVLAAWLFVFTPLALGHDKIVRTDSAGLFWSLLSLWFVFRFVDRPDLVRVAMAGLVIGLSIATRYFGMAVLAVLVAAAVQRYWRVDKRKMVIYIVVGVAMMLVGFFASTPYFVLDFTTVLANLQVEARQTNVGADGLSPIGNFLWYLTTAPLTIFSWGQIPFLLLGSGWLAYKGNFRQRLLLLYVLTFVGMISLSALHWLRWLIPLLPLLAMATVYAIVRLFTLPALPLFVRSYGSWIAVALLSVQPVYNSVVLIVTHARPTTRVLAVEWANAHLPSDTLTVTEAYTGIDIGQRPNVIAVFTLAQYNSIEGYCTLGVDYLSTSTWMSERFFKEPERYPAEMAFYRYLYERSDALAAEFIPSPPTMAGPAVRFYQMAKICTR